MSNLLKSPNLLRRDPPEALDRRILLAGALAAARRRSSRRRLVGIISGAAAASVAVAVLATWNLTTPSPAGNGKNVRHEQRGEQPISEPETSDFNDYWTSVEQENYNLASQLDYCDQDVQDPGIFS